MWLCLNNAFLSIVSKDCPADCLLVRARRKGDIEAVFPDAAVKRTVGNDYLYRAVVKRVHVSAVLAQLAQSIDYDNFKNSVHDNQLHNAYSKVWGVMSHTQEIAPYSRSRAPARRGHRDLFPGA